MRYLFCILFAFIIGTSFGQEKAKLFIHFDKNVYSDNEHAYFTGYLVKEGNVPTKNHKALAIALIRNMDSTVISTKKFVMQNGLAQGDFELPDSIHPGNYRLLAYTDQLINGLPEATFEQQITIKTRKDPPFKVNMKLVDEIKPGDQTYKVLITATTPDNRFLSKSLNISYRYGRDIKKAKTDASGQLALNLPIKSNTDEPNLYLTVSDTKDTTFMQIALPRVKPKARVNFYPEGGHAIVGIGITIAFEVKDEQRMPLTLKSLLFKNDEVIDTVETDTYGFGKFRLMYEQDAKYTFKLVHDGIADSIYHLPQPLSHGAGLSIAKAVVNDTLRLQLRSTENRKIYIRIHNFRETFLNQPFNMAQNSQSFKIPLLEMPKGLLAITISDSAEQPLAERIFFAHYDNQELLQLRSDSQEYGQREKVTISLNLPDSVTRGLVSIAVVQNNRLELKKMKDIESYTYLNSELIDLPTHLMGRAYKDREHLENILLTKAWRKYNWEGMGKLQKTDSVSFTAQILKNNKVLKAPIMVGVLGNSYFQTDSTSSTGLLNLIKPQYTSNIKGNLQLFVNGNSNGAYRIHINDGFNKMSEQLKKIAVAEEILSPSTLTNNTDLILKGNEKAIILNEVVIKSKPDRSFHRTNSGALGSNACGDYVCVYNIFNCPNHQFDAGNTQPIKGRTYGRLTGPYIGCITETKADNNLFKFDFVRYAKEFYENDYQDPREPAFFSTIYWNYGLVLNKKTNSISFYTSDIIGKFRIIAQGILGNDVVYAEHFFEVKPKQNP